MESKLSRDTQDVKSIFIAWVPFQRRPLNMKDHFNFEVHFLDTQAKNLIQKVWKYIRASISTLILLNRCNGESIWIQTPPSIPLFVAFLANWRARKILIADCHNRTFEAPWVDFPFSVRLHNMCDIILVHNAAIYERVANNLISQDKLMTLHTRPMRYTTPELTEVSGVLRAFDIASDFVLIPLSWNPDEPIGAIFELATRMPQVNFVLTGRPKTAEQKAFLVNHRPNVKLIGFVHVNFYNVLLSATKCVIGFTEKADVQLSVANEAIGMGKALLLSDTPTLRSLFNGPGVAFVNHNDLAYVVEILHKILHCQDKIAHANFLLRVSKEAAWQQQAKQLANKIYSTLNKTS